MNRKQNGNGVAKEAAREGWRMDAGLLGDIFHREVWSISNVGSRPEENRGDGYGDKQGVSLRDERRHGTFFMDIFASPFKNKGPVMRLLLLSFCLSLGACASVKVNEVKMLTKQPPVGTPLKIFVKPFAFYEPAVRVDRTGKNLEEFKYELQEKFTRHLVANLRQTIAPAKAIAATAPVPQGKYWLITGRFDRVYQGSRLLRSVVGFGAGGTKFDTSVMVWDLSQKTPRPFLLLETKGDSFLPQGTMGKVGYFASSATGLTSAASLVGGVREGLTFDTIRTSREVSRSFSEYLWAQSGTTPPR